MRDRQLIDTLEKWRPEYDFNLQLWSEDRVNVSITKGGVHLFESNQHENIRNGLLALVEWCEKQNPSGKVTPKKIVSRCMGCGCKVAIGNDLCGECACEYDDDYL